MGGGAGGGELAARPGCERRRDWRQRGGPSASSSPHSSRGLPRPWQLGSQAAAACSVTHAPQLLRQDKNAAHLRAALTSAEAAAPPPSTSIHGLHDLSCNCYNLYLRGGCATSPARKCCVNHSRTLLQLVYTHTAAALGKASAQRHFLTLQQ